MTLSANGLATWLSNAWALHAYRFAQAAWTMGASMLLIGASIGAASAQAVEYVRVCSAYGAGYYYTPGTDRCAYGNNMPYRYETEFGTAFTQFGTATAYGADAFAVGARGVAIGNHAFSGSDPFSASPGAGRGIDGQVPRSSFFNANTTAVGADSRAGATAAGQDNATAIGQGAQANAANATAIGQGAQANATGSVALGMGSIANEVNTVSIGAVGSERRLVNLSNGRIGSGSTDAINGGQFYTANQRVATAFGTTLDGNGQLNAPNYLIQGTTYSNVGSAFGAVDSRLDTLSSRQAYVQVNSTGPTASATGANALAFGSNAQATQSGAVAIGFNSSSTGTNAIAIGTGASATGSVAVGAAASAANGGASFGDGAVATGPNAAALGPNATATAANSVAIGAGSTNTAANTVSFGSAGNARRLTNVAAGISPTDAVNVGQLNSVAGGFSDQITDLQSQTSRLRDGVAVALAVGGSAPLQAGRKFALSTSFGNFQGASAVGLGATALVHQTQGYALTVNAGAGWGVNTNSVGTRAAVTMQW
jgi:autotransporter adhesin